MDLDFAHIHPFILEQTINWTGRWLMSTVGLTNVSANTMCIINMTRFHVSLKCKDGRVWEGGCDEWQELRLHSPLGACWLPNTKHLLPSKDPFSNWVYFTYIFMRMLTANAVCCNKTIISPPLGPCNVFLSTLFTDYSRDELTEPNVGGVKWG